MNPAQPTYDWKRGLLEARLRFWLTVPNATAMCAKIEAELNGAASVHGLPSSAGSMGQESYVAPPMKAPHPPRTSLEDQNV